MDSNPGAAAVTIQLHGLSTYQLSNYNAAVKTGVSEEASADNEILPSAQCVEYTTVNVVNRHR